MDELKAGKLSPAFSKMNDDLTAAAKSIDEYETSKMKKSYSRLKKVF
ncbi:hypothetical protein KEH51_24765 [[Brevibacterium] frigoritolerans]|uniref:Uncharacterized protein n=1 Tax=Peribacillus frigoritolerans TaxID=450367 RepID=A0A941FTT0_9BACI|nr:hypothetical protein [Peribacillus frigoritolerans]